MLSAEASGGEAAAVSEFYMRPLTLAEARQGVNEWHSHHSPHMRHRLALGAFVDGSMVAACVWEDPKAQALRGDGRCWELSRLACGPDAPKYTASRLIGASTSAVLKLGITRCVSYTRVDERGTCYKASNWHPVSHVRGRDWTSGNKSTRWLPGLYEPSTEVIDRVRWEAGPGAAPANWCVLDRCAA